MNRFPTARTLRSLLVMAALAAAAAACTDPVGPDFDQGQNSTFEVLVVGSHGGGSAH